MSEVFVVAWRRRDDEPVDRLPWLLAVARRVIANGRRSDERVDALRLRLAGQPPPAEPDHGDVVAVRDTWSRALAQLSQDDQEVLALVAWDQLSASQAAAVLGCSTATFLVRLSRTAPSAHPPHQRHRRACRLEGDRLVPHPGRTDLTQLRLLDPARHLESDAARTQAALDAVSRRLQSEAGGSDLDE